MQNRLINHVSVCFTGFNQCISILKNFWIKIDEIEGEMNICFIYGVNFQPNLLLELGSTELEEGITHSGGGMVISLIQGNVCMFKICCWQGEWNRAIEEYRYFGDHKIYRDQELT